VAGPIAIGRGAVCIALRGRKVGGHLKALNVDAMGFQRRLKLGGPVAEQTSRRVGFRPHIDPQFVARKVHIHAHAAQLRRLEMQTCHGLTGAGVQTN
jgi:hypothetical protein